MEEAGEGAACGLASTTADSGDQAALPAASQAAAAGKERGLFCEGEQASYLPRRMNI